MLDVPPMLCSSHRSMFTVPMQEILELLPVSREELKNSAETINLKTHKKSVESPKPEELSALVESMVDSISAEPSVMESTKEMIHFPQKNK